MRLSRVLFASLREAPADAASDAERLLVRAGFLRRTDGSRTWLPLGGLALRRLETLLGAALDELGCREAVVPAQRGVRQDRGEAAGSAGDRIADPAPFAAAFASAVRSYRQLPAAISTSRDARRRAGREPLLGADERRVIDLGIACREDEELAAELARVEEAIGVVLGALGVAAVPAGWAIPSAVGRALALVHPAGDEELLACESCGYAAERDVARVTRQAPASKPLLPVAEVETPETTTIAALAAFLGVGPERCAKAAFFEADDGRLVTAIVRGDHEVSEAKLASAVGARDFTPAPAERIRAAGMEPGYGSPVGAHGTTVVVDAACAASPNLVAGANRPGWHLRNVNVGRDYAADGIADIARAADGDACPTCARPLHARAALALAVLGPAATPQPPSYLAADGTSRAVALGLGRLELERILVAAVESHRDERGIVWPPALAPLPIHLVTLAADRDEAVAASAEALEAAARGAGGELLWDDRVESPGVKFADADLIGLPVRLTISPRSLASGGVEVVSRSGGGERRVVPGDEARAMVGAAARGLVGAGELSNNR